MELLLVLAILVVVGAVVMPSILGPLQNQKLRKSADLTRAAWSRARVNAMRTGLIHIFEYEPSTGNYSIKPWAAEQDQLEANPLETPLGNAPGQSAYEAYHQQEQLPDEILFAEGSAEADLRWQMHATVEGKQNNTETNRSPPIVFYPDGTTSNAQVWLTRTDGKFFISVQMRGMTGVSRIGPLIAAGDLP